MRGPKTIWILIVCMLMIGCSKEGRNKGGPEVGEISKEESSIFMGGMK